MKEKLVVKFDVGGCPNFPHSFRGYYDDLALEPFEGITLVKKLLELLKKSLNKEFTGYKGGEFLMDARTPLWMSKYGSSVRARAIMNVRAVNGEVVLITKEIDEE